MNQEELDDVELEINYYYQNGYIAHYDRNGVLQEILPRTLTPLERNIRKFIFEDDCDECCCEDELVTDEDDWWPFFDGDSDVVEAQ